MPTVRTCQECGGEKEDVYRFRIVLEELKVETTGYPVRDLCPNCYFYYERRGARLETVDTREEFVEGRRPTKVYDNKPRFKLF